jgi:uncharacterized protein
MKRRLGTFLSLLIVAATAFAGPYEDGITAYDQGRFDAAFELWRSLAEQGHALAQFNLGVLFEP